MDKLEKAFIFFVVGVVTTCVVIVLICLAALAVKGTWFLLTH